MDAVLSYIGHILVVILCWAIALSIALGLFLFILDTLLFTFTKRGLCERRTK